MAIHKPSWFSDKTVMVSTAPTCGLSRGGRPLFQISRETGKRVEEVDPETNELVDAIDDRLLLDAVALSKGQSTATLRHISASSVSTTSAVPVYYDRSVIEAFEKAMAEPRFQDFEYASIGDLKTQGVLTVRGGHGSPSAGERVGRVPYIKVSDLRAGLVNINPTNRVPRKVAERFWRGESSGLRPFDLLCPERTSKNIGDFCVLMPGQEQVVLTKEIIILRPGKKANFDPFYLLWAMTLAVVREQWRRVVFMQTNREDVGKRYLEILIPVPKSRDSGNDASAEFRCYYQTISAARGKLSTYLAQTGDHHFFVSGAEALESADDEADEADLAMAKDGDEDADGDGEQGENM